MNFMTVLCDNTIRNGKTVCLTAVGESMWPVKAVISPLQSELPKKGSLLLIERANGLVVHRYWGVTDQEGVPLLLTKGDTNLAFDPPVSISGVLGQVSLLKKNTGDCRDPNHGWLYLVGRFICSSYNVAGFWARSCRVMIRLLKKFA